MTTSQLYLQGAAFAVETKKGLMVSITPRSRRDVEQGHAGQFAAFAKKGDKVYRNQLIPSEVWNKIASAYDLKKLDGRSTKNWRVDLTSAGANLSVAFSGQVLGGGRGVKWDSVSVENIPAFDIDNERQLNAEARAQKEAQAQAQA